MVVIFDLDGTLINTIADLGVACNYALSATGYPIHSPEQYSGLVGNGISKLIERALPDVVKQDEGILQQTIDSVRDVFVPYYNEHNCDLTHPYDGIIELLKKLKDNGCKLAVASNKYQAATSHIIEHFFPGIFDVVLGERENVARKPDPQIVRDILNQLTLAQGEKVLYVGDSLVDVATACNSNLPVAACSWGFVDREKLEQAEPDYIVDKPLQIWDIVKGDLLKN